MAARAIEFRERMSFPVVLEADGKADGKEAHYDPRPLETYFALNEAGFGGWYPIGAAQTWHNGIHLAVPEGTPVRSIARGTIIAARLADPPTEERGRYGTPTFVLIKHTMEILENPKEIDHNSWRTRNVEFYSLYMHVDLTTRKTNDVPWFQSFLPFLEENKCTGNLLAKINTAEDRDGSAFGLFCRTAPAKKGEAYVKGEKVKLIPRGTIIEVSNETRGSWQRANVPSMGLTDVWVYSPGNRFVEVKDFEEQLRAFQSQGCAKFNYPVRSGEVIGHVGKIRPRRVLRGEFSDVFGVHLEVFSRENIIHPSDMNAWTLIDDDTDDDVLCEFNAVSKKLRRPEVVESLGWDTTKFASDDAIVRYFRTLGTEDRAWLRGLIVHTTSFWAIDWSNMLRSNKAWAELFDFDETDATIASQYMWWDECQTLGVDLPPRVDNKALVYHYHPLSLIRYIEDHRPPFPVFHVIRNQQEFVVARPSDINIAAREKVYVHERTDPDWLLGRGGSAQGCEGLEHFGSTTLYAALIDPATTAGIPPLDSSSKRVWASIYMSEGCLDGINSYDSAFLSFGPIQQASGKAADEGELQGALYSIKQSNPPLFKKYFGDFTLDVDSVVKVQKIDKGHFTLNGKVLKTAADKESLRDFVWAYRCVKAMNDAVFRRLFLEHGFKRLDIVKDLTADVGGAQVRLGDVYRMEASLALLLDAHINLPKLVDSPTGIWVKAAKSALGLGENKPINPTTITRDQEYAMIASIVGLRNESSMWNPASRAAFILLCTKGLDDALARKFGYADLDALKLATGLSTVTLANDYVRDFLEHIR